MSLLEKPLNKSKPKPTFTYWLTYSRRVCEGGLGRRACGEENPLESGQRKQSKMSGKRRGAREEERRLIAERRVGRRGARTGCQVTRRQRRKEAGAWRAPDLQAPSPPLPGSRCGQTPRVAETARSWGVGGGVGREGGTGTKELSAPDRAWRAAHLASRTRHLPGAHRRSGQGCGLGER